MNTNFSETKVFEQRCGHRQYTCNYGLTLLLFKYNFQSVIAGVGALYQNCQNDLNSRDSSVFTTYILIGESRHKVKVKSSTGKLYMIILKVEIKCTYFIVYG